MEQLGYDCISSNSFAFGYDLETVVISKAGFKIGAVVGGETIPNAEGLTVTVIDLADFDSDGNLRGDYSGSDVDRVKQSMDIVSTIDHELGHSVTGLTDYSDAKKPNANNDPGPNERYFVNPKRASLGNLQRLNYSVDGSNGSKFTSFGNSAGVETGRFTSTKLNTDLLSRICKRIEQTFLFVIK